VPGAGLQHRLRLWELGSAHSALIKHWIGAIQVWPAWLGSGIFYKFMFAAYHFDYN